MRSTQTERFRRNFSGALELVDNKSVKALSKNRLRIWGTWRSCHVIYCKAFRGLRKHFLLHKCQIVDHFISALDRTNRMIMNRRKWRSRRTHTVTDLVRFQDQQLYRIAAQASLYPEVIDLPATDPARESKIRSSMYSGADLHRSITAAVLGKIPMPAFAAIARRLLGWLRQNGAARIEPEFALECSDLHGQCDLFVHGATFSHRGIVEVKACNELPSAPNADDRLQLALYVHAAASQIRGDDAPWGALVYCSLQSGALRVFLWKTIHVHALAVGMAIRMAA